MKIITKPVKFGDCNIICGESKKLLVDCGSDNRDTDKSGRFVSSREFAFSKIAYEIPKKRLIIY